MFICISANNVIKVLRVAFRELLIYHTEQNSKIYIYQNAIDHHSRLLTLRLNFIRTRVQKPGVPL